MKYRRELKFAQEFVKDHNASAAARRAGYTGRQAKRLLKVPSIAKLIDEYEASAKERAIVTEAWVLSRLKEVAERSMQHEAVMVFDHELKEMVQEKTLIVDKETGEGKMIGVYEFDSAGANRSLELLGKHLKMFTDKMEVDVNEGAFERLERARRLADENSKR